MLLGSSVLPSVIWCDGRERQLGDFVRRAFTDSGLTVEEWNALPEREREYKLVDAVYDMRAEPAVARDV